MRTRGQLLKIPHFSAHSAGGKECVPEFCLLVGTLQFYWVRSPWKFWKFLQQFLKIPTCPPKYMTVWGEGWSPNSFWVGILLFLLVRSPRLFFMLIGIIIFMLLKGPWDFGNGGEKNKKKRINLPKIVAYLSLLRWFHALRSDQHIFISPPFICLNICSINIIGNQWQHLCGRTISHFNTIVTGADE
jgi:hypothetical protein